MPSAWISGLGCLNGPASLVQINIYEWRLVLEAGTVSCDLDSGTTAPCMTTVVSKCSASLQYIGGRILSAFHFLKICKIDAENPRGVYCDQLIVRCQLADNGQQNSFKINRSQVTIANTMYCRKPHHLFIEVYISNHMID